MSRCEIGSWLANRSQHAGSCDYRCMCVYKLSLIHIYSIELMRKSEAVVKRERGEILCGQQVR